MRPALFIGLAGVPEGGGGAGGVASTLFSGCPLPCTHQRTLLGRGWMIPLSMCSKTVYRSWSPLTVMACL